MKSYLKNPVSYAMAVGLLLGCQNNYHHTVKSAFQKSLIQKRIKGTPYNLSLPANYVVKEKDGPDFSVYYFQPYDTADKTSFRGGFHLGNAPGSFNKDYSTCKTDSLHSSFLGEDKQWTIYDCDGKYSIQIITGSKSGMSWGRLIHSFGRANSKAEVNKLLEVYSTLAIKK